MTVQAIHAVVVMKKVKMHTKDLCIMIEKSWNKIFTLNDMGLTYGGI